MGEWAERGSALDYLGGPEVHCACCGRLLARRAWVAEVEGAERVFCEEACERLYRDWWLPRHGRGAAP